MPTLLSVNNYFYPRGGAEVVFLEHNAIFKKAGWNVACFSMNHPNNPPSEWSRYFIDEIEFGGNYTLLQKMARVPKVIYSMESRRKISRLLNDIPVDICHMHNIYHHISPSVLGVLHDRKIPTVLTLHDLKIACPEYHMLSSGRICERCRGGNRVNVIINKCIKDSYILSGLIFIEDLLHRILKSYSNKVDKFIVPSRFYLEKFSEWGWDREKFAYIPNFIDTSLFQPSFNPGKEFVYFGRLSKEKGISTLIQAAAKANVRLKIIGSGPDEHALKQLSATLESKVTFAGYMTGKLLHETIRSSRAVVLPSEWYENAPLSVLESYALGKPVIASSIGGIPELVLEGETGTIFNPGDVDQLAAALDFYHNQPDRFLAEQGRTARTWVEDEFSREKYLKNICSLYRELGVSCQQRHLP